MILGMLIAVAVPLLFLTLMRWLIVYADDDYRARNAAIHFSHSSQLAL